MAFVRILWHRKYLLVTCCFILLLSSSFFFKEHDFLIAVLSVIPIGVACYLFFFENKNLYLLLAFIVPLSIPLNILSGSQISFPSELIMGILAIYLLIKNIFTFSIDKKIWVHPLTYLVLLDLCWMTVASLFSSMPTVSCKRLLVRTCFITVFYFGFASLVKNPVNYLKLFLFFAMGSVVPAISSLIFLYQHDFIIMADTQMTKPFFTDHAVWGACMAFIIPFIFFHFFYSRGFLKWMILFLLIIVFAGLIFSFSRAAWISLCVAGIGYLFVLLKIRMPLLLLITVSVFFILFVFRSNIETYLKANDAVSNKDLVQHVQSVGNIKSDASNTERINRWKSAWRMFLERPFTGFGPGTYQFVYGRFQSHTDMTRISTFNGDKGGCHSEYLTSLSETGLPGFIILLLLALTSIQISIKNIYRSKGKTKQLILSAYLGLITFYFHGLFNNFIDTDKMALLVIGAWGIILWCDVRLSAEEKNADSIKISL
ncbi:MAG: O-antigen ligase family protein [Bacteroidia bacterium]